jgi:hypothetical protein
MLCVTHHEGLCFYLARLGIFFTLPARCQFPFYAPPAVVRFNLRIKTALVTQRINILYGARPSVSPMAQRPNCPFSSRYGFRRRRGYFFAKQQQLSGTLVLFYAIDK